jgi:glycosyltransferase involved in cell wall biosynthesis
LALFPNVTVKVAPELSPKDILPDFSPVKKPLKQPGELKLVYFSRVTPKKNLGFLLSVLKQFRSGSVHLEIIGPTDDELYLERCKRIAGALPPNVTVSFLGGVGRDAALELIRTAHFMALPTKNENYGYVIIESLAAGCPVLLSDQVSWDGVEESGAGWLVPLSEARWKEMLEHCLLMDSEQFLRMSFCARDFAVKYLATEEHQTVNQLIFDSVLSAPYANG